MRAPSSRPASQRRFMWLLWLALLLPMGQSVAAWHALSHTRADSSDADGKQAPHPTHCDLCLTAAAVSGGALPSQAPALPQLSARHAAPQAAADSVWLALPALAYLSRAPPRSSH